jgi:hypothetical protein
MKNDPLFKFVAAALLLGVFLSLIIPTHAFEHHSAPSALDVAVQTAEPTE